MEQSEKENRIVNESMNDLRSSLNIQTLRLHNMINRFSATQVQDIISILLKRGKREIQLA